MLNRKTIFSLIAVATLAVAAALTATSADARPNGHGAKGHGGGGIQRHVGIGRHHLRHLRPNFRRHIVMRPHWCLRHPWRCRRPIHIVRYPVATTGVATAAVTRAAPSCTCLTKTYLPNGAVLFKDVCTQETAINPPEQQAQVQ